MEAVVADVRLDLGRDYVVLAALQALVGDGGDDPYDRSIHERVECQRE